jgi:DDE domain
MVYLWRAVDAEGEVLDVLVQSKRNKNSALKLMRKLLRKYAVVPERLVTDDLRSYGAATLDFGIDHLIGMLFSSPRRAQRSSTRRGAAKSRALGLKRSGKDMASIQTKFRTSLPSAVILLTNCLALPESARNAPLSWCNGMVPLRGSPRPVSFKLRLRCYASFG